MWVIPPEQSGTFVAHMEDILELYHMPYDPQVPLVCMDEQPVQLIKGTRTPLPAEQGTPERYDAMIMNTSATALLPSSCSLSR
jgi:hypothetical protein